MERKSLISVVIPTYRRSEKLKLAIKSILDQNYSVFEILVVNDDHKDESVQKVIDKLCDNRIKYFTNKRTKGPCGARNTGILNAKGEIVAFLDDDDLWLPDRMNEINKVFLKPNVTGVVSEYKTIYKNKVKDVLLRNHDKVLENYLIDKFSLVCGSNLVLSSEVINKIGLFDEELIRQEDTEYMVRYLSQYNIHIINKPLIIIQLHEYKPDPDLTIETRTKFLLKIQSIVNNLDKKHKNKFYSNHYRRIGILYLQKGNIKSAFSFINKAMKYELFSPRKDLKFLLGVLKYNIN